METTFWLIKIGGRFLRHVESVMVCTQSKAAFRFDSEDEAKHAMQHVLSLMRSAAATNPNDRKRWRGKTVSINKYVVTAIASEAIL